MFKFLQRKKVSPVHLAPGDTFVLLSDGKELMREEFKQADTIDEIGIAEFKDEFNMDHGTVGVFGKSRD